MRRLQHSAKIYRMEYALDLAGWNEAVLETIRANEMKACYIRPILYRGYDSLGVNPLTCPVDAAIMLWEWGAYLGKEALEQGIDVKMSSWSRMAPNTLPAMAKSAANYANSALIKMEAHRRRLRRGDRARRLRQHQRRQRPEHLHRARRRDLHAAARLVDPRRHHPRLGDDAGARPRLYRQRVGDPARGAVHRRRGVLRRHGRRGHADPLGRQAADRHRPARADHRRRCSRRSSTSSTARCPTRTAGSPTSTRPRARFASRSKTAEPGGLER